jgi:hypothetical protein
MLMENKMFNQPTGGPMRRERPGRDLEAMEKKNQLPYVQMLAMRRKYPDPAPSAPTSVPAAADSSMSDVAPRRKKNPKVPVVPADSMNAEDIALRRSARVANKEEKKEAEKKAEAEIAGWKEEVKKGKEQRKLDKAFLKTKVQGLLDSTESTDELMGIVEELSRLGESDAAEAVLQLVQDKGDLELEEEVKDEVSIGILRKFIEKGFDAGEGTSDAVRDAIEQLRELDDVSEYEQKLERIGGRRRKTKKNKKSRRKTKRGGSEEDPNAPIQPPPKKKTKPSEPEQSDVEMGGRRKTKRSRRTTRR